MGLNIKVLGVLLKTPYLAKNQAFLVVLSYLVVTLVTYRTLLYTGKLTSSNYWLNLLPIWMPKDVRVFEFDVILYVRLRKEDLMK